MELVIISQVLMNQNRSPQVLNTNLRHNFQRCNEASLIMGIEGVWSPDESS